MKNIYLLLLTFLAINLNVFAQYSEQDIHNYILKYKALAIQEQVRTGVPAAITLAQGILESGAGTSELCLQADNHFGIKCKSSWQGATYKYSDDAKDECFRKYNDYYQSYTDHSDFLKDNKRYAELFLLDIEDYKGWAHGLKKAGYATSPIYANKLIGLIERFNLYEYTIVANTPKEEGKSEIQIQEIKQYKPDDFAIIKTSYNTAIEETSEDTTINNQAPMAYYQITKLHGLNGFYAKKGDLLLEFAIRNRIRYAKLLSLNDLNDAPLPYDMFIYIEPKNRTGERPSVILHEGETLHLISQREGITMEALRLLNHLNEYEEPAPGTTIYLQTLASEKPLLRHSQDATNVVSSPIDDDLLETGNEFIDKPTANQVSTEQLSESAAVQQVTKDLTQTGVKVKEVQIEKEKLIEKENENYSENLGAKTDRTSKQPESQETVETELDRLKRRMDRSVYIGNPNPPAENHAVNDNKSSTNNVHAESEKTTENTNNTDKKDLNEALIEHMKSLEKNKK